MNKHIREQIFARLKAENPNPKTELEYNSVFELLIAVVLSAQATDVSVNKATRKLFPVANTPQAIYEMGVDKLKEYIKTIGLYNTKAENIIKTCKVLMNQKELMNQHNSVVPATREALEALPGVGRKTANVILNTAFRQPVMAVDTHIFRVANRTRIAKGKNVLEVEERLIRNIPKAYLLDAHHWLILHGRYICTARKPKCAACVIENLCEYKEKVTD